MVLREEQELDAIFHALAHPARRAMVQRLSRAEHSLSELAAPLEMSFPAASKHVRVLERAKLVKRRVVGREHRCSLQPAALSKAGAWTEKFRAAWEARFQALDALLDDMQQKGGASRG